MSWGLYNSSPNLLFHEVVVGLRGWKSTCVTFLYSHFFHCLGGQIVPFSGVWFAPSRSVENIIMRLWLAQIAGSQHT